MSRIFEETRESLTFDMGEKAEGSWLRADAIHGCVAFDMSSMDGELILSPRHAEALGARLLLWADAKGTPREQHLLRVIDEMAPIVTAARGVLGVARDSIPARLDEAIDTLSDAVKSYDDHANGTPNLNQKEQ